MNGRSMRLCVMPAPTRIIPCDLLLPNQWAASFRSTVIVEELESPTAVYCGLMK